jgi:uncharacterized protein involved in exopolysaccharide biosynthesis
MKNSRNGIDSYQLNDEVDLFLLWKIIWKGRRVVLVIVSIFVIAALIYAYYQINIYRAEAVLAPAPEERLGGSAVSNLGLAANINGLAIGQSNSRIQHVLATLQSRRFMTQFIEEHDLLPSLMASRWDKNENRNIVDFEMYDPQTDSWLGDQVDNKPSSWSAFKAMSRILNVSEDRQTGMVTISIEWSDPEQAAQWVNWVVTDINKKIKEQDLEEASNAIEYLRGQLSATNLVEMQRVFYQLIESQTRIVMLADVREGYVLQVIDPAVPPEDIVRPNRLAIVLFGILVGLLVGTATSFIIHKSPNGS